MSFTAETSSANTNVMLELLGLFIGTSVAAVAVYVLLVRALVFLLHVLGLMQYGG